MTAPTLRVNGAEVQPAIRATGSVSRKLVWLSVAGRGRFLCSLVPYPGHPFQKAGVVSAFGISFNWNGVRYDWQSRAPITESSGNWNLYVLQAPPSSDTSALGFSFGGANSVEEFLAKAP